VSCFTGQGQSGRPEPTVYPHPLQVGCVIFLRAEPIKHRILSAPCRLRSHHVWEACLA